MVLDSSDYGAIVCVFYSWQAGNNSYLSVRVDNGAKRPSTVVRLVSGYGSWLERQIL